MLQQQIEQLQREMRTVEAKRNFETSRLLLNRAQAQQKREYDQLLEQYAKLQGYPRDEETIVDAEVRPEPVTDPNATARAGDTVDVIVSGEAELPEFSVEADGTIRLPFIGSIEVKGLTTRTDRRGRREALDRSQARDEPEGVSDAATALTPRARHCVWDRKYSSAVPMTRTSLAPFLLVGVTAVLMAAQPGTSKFSAALAERPDVKQALDVHRPALRRPGEGVDHAHGDPGAVDARAEARGVHPRPARGDGPQAGDRPASATSSRDALARAAARRSPSSRTWTPCIRWSTDVTVKRLPDGTLHAPGVFDDTSSDVELLQMLRALDAAKIRTKGDLIADLQRAGRARPQGDVLLVRPQPEGRRHDRRGRRRARRGRLRRARDLLVEDEVHARPARTRSIRAARRTRRARPRSASPTSTRFRCRRPTRRSPPSTTSA